MLIDISAMENAIEKLFKFCPLDYGDRYDSLVLSAQKNIDVLFSDAAAKGLDTFVGRLREAGFVEDSVVLAYVNLNDDFCYSTESSASLLQDLKNSINKFTSFRCVYANLREWVTVSGRDVHHASPDVQLCWLKSVRYILEKIKWVMEILERAEEEYYLQCAGKWNSLMKSKSWLANDPLCKGEFSEFALLVSLGIHKGLGTHYPIISCMHSAELSVH